MKTIVISAVNLNVGGTLTVLKECLAHLSSLAEKENYRIVAIVYKKELAEYPNIEYIETQWPKKRWINRLWYEYVSLKEISKEISPVFLWLSLHDTSPSVIAERRAVYCHNSFPFYKWKWKEIFFAPKIVLFALFSKYVYKKNIDKNDFIIVQQQWLKKALINMFGLPKEKFIVAIPEMKESIVYAESSEVEGVYSFLYAASADSHKNFECLCRAAELLEAEGVNDFKVFITVDGKENTYANWLALRYKGKVKGLNFIGYQDRNSLYEYYEKSDCLVFPSKVETWGLPITEFGAFDKPMLLADLPYAHETAAKAKQVAFFDPSKPLELAVYMKELIRGNDRFLRRVDSVYSGGQQVENWENLFKVLLKEESIPPKSSELKVKK